MSIDFSVIIATFNSGKYLRDCLNAVFAQTYSNYEVIVVDGGSTDETVDIIKDFEQIYSLKWISEKDNGIYDAWNKGLKLCEGEWITFVGSDDIVSDYWLRIIKDKIEVDDSLNYISGEIQFVDSNLDPIRIWGNRWSAKKNERFMSVAHVGSVHRMCLFQDFGFFNTKYRHVADYEFLLRVSDSIRAGFVSEIIAKMRIGGSSDSIEAIWESFIVKKENGYLPYYKNLVYTIWAILAYYKRIVFRRFIN